MPRFATSIISGAITSLALLSARIRAWKAYQQSVTRVDKPVENLRDRRAVATVHVDDREILRGGDALVATPQRIVHLDAIGKADIGEGKPMRPDTIFWIASMTKPITATAVLMTRTNEGKLSIDDPVEKILAGIQESEVRGPQAAARSPSVTCSRTHRA